MLIRFSYYQSLVYKKKLIVLAFIVPLFMIPLSLVDTSYGQESLEFTSYYDQLSVAEKSAYDVCVDPFNAKDPKTDTWTELTSDKEVSNLVTEQATVDMAAKIASLENPGYFWLLNAPELNADKTLTFDIGEFNKDDLETIKLFANQARIDAGTDPSFFAVISAIDSKLREEVELARANETGPSLDNAYGAIVEGKADSLGFAAAFKYCLQEIYKEDDDKDVVTIYGKLVSTQGSESHAWNAVNEGEGWFGVDVALNKKFNVSTYLMMASNTQGHQTNYTFEASHQPDMGVLLGNYIRTPDIQYVEPPPPPELTFLDQWGSHIIIITIIAILCVILLVFARRS